MLRVKVCREADAEHRKSIRQYAHTMHYPNTICIADAFYDLPEKHKIGIVLHELGHLMGAEAEDDADNIIWEVFQIKLYRKHSRYGRNLETV